MALKSSLVSQAPSPNGRAAPWRRNHSNKQSRRPWRQCRRRTPLAPIGCGGCSATASPGLRRLERYSDSLPFLHHAHKAGKAVLCAQKCASRQHKNQVSFCKPSDFRGLTTVTASRRSRKDCRDSTPLFPRAQLLPHFSLITTIEPKRSLALCSCHCSGQQSHLAGIWDFPRYELLYSG